MRKIIIIVSIVIGFLPKAIAQIGIGTENPLSTLHNTGSYAGDYIVNPGTTYTLGADYIVDYTDNVANTVYMLPSISEGSATNRNGRMYFIRNASATNSLTIRATGTESINTGSTSANTLLLEPSRSVIIVRNASATGTNSNTWNAVNYSPLLPLTTTYIRKFYRSPSMVTNTITLNGTTTTTATAATFNKFSTGASTAKNLLDTNFTLTSPKLVNICFTAAADDIATDPSGTPFVYYYLEIYNTVTDAVVTGTGSATIFGTKVQMHGAWHTSFTVSGTVTIPAGTYNARLKALVNHNITTIILGFTSYSFVASYTN